MLPMFFLSTSLSSDYAINGELPIDGEDQNHPNWIFIYNCIIFILKPVSLRTIKYNPMNSILINFCLAIKFIRIIKSVLIL